MTNPDPLPGDEDLEDVMSEWVSASERLPDKYCHVLLYREREDYSLPGFYDGENFFALTADIGKSWHSGVTHWMPLPEPPIGGEQ